MEGASRDARWPGGVEDRSVWVAAVDDGAAAGSRDGGAPTDERGGVTAWLTWPGGGSDVTTLTGVPISVIEARCRTEAFNMRKQPDDSARPIDFTSLVPWMR